MLEWFPGSYLPEPAGSRQCHAVHGSTLGHTANVGVATKVRLQLLDNTSLGSEAAIMLLRKHPENHRQLCVLYSQ